MIVAERKSLDEIEAMVEGFERILVAGCGTCVAVCMAGGEKEVELLAAELRMRARLKGRTLLVDEITITRQCDREYLESLARYADDYDAIVSTACGAGVQFLAERYDDRIVLPALNTLFIGVADDVGVWKERCSACSACILDRTGGICPVTRCPKMQLNGPCGGTDNGKCEVNPGNDCAWTLIYRRLESLGRLDVLKTTHPPRDWSLSTKPKTFTHKAFQEACQEE